MSMTRRDYEILADKLRDALYQAPSVEQASGVALAARLVAEGLKSGNPRFRFDRFYDACELDSWGELKGGE